MCHMEIARKRKMQVELESLHLQHLLSHNSLAECLLKKQQHNNISTIMQRMTTAKSTRAVGPFQQCVWATLHIHITPDH